MKRNIMIAFLTLSGIVVLSIAGIQLAGIWKGRVAVKELDQKGIFVGDPGKADPFVVTSEGKTKQERPETEHERVLRQIDEAWHWIGVGGDYFKQGRYEEAAQAFEKAYAADPRSEPGGSYSGSRDISGGSLVRTYEKLGRYDDGINLLEQMLRNREVRNPVPIKLARAHIARLKALKEGRPVPEYKNPFSSVPALDVSAYIFDPSEIEEEPSSS